MALPGKRSWRDRWKDAAGGTWRPVAILFSGTALAQLVPLAASPLLARLYAPTDFGLYAWALSIVALTSLFASGAFNQAVNIPTDPQEAVRLAWLVGLGGAATAVLLGVAGVATALILHRWEHSMWFIPAATWLLCIQNAAGTLATREARFRTLARARVVLAVVSIAVSLAGGWLHAGAIGLMVGNLSGVAAGCFYLLGANPSAGKLTSFPRPGELLRTARKYVSFPLWQLPAAFVDALATQSPVWLISSFFGIDTLGQFSLAARALGAPLQLLGTSFGEVFRQQASLEWRTLGHCRPTLRRFSLLLASLVLPAVVLLAVFGPGLVTVFFGSKWILAGEFVRFLALLYALRGSVGTLSYVLILGARQRTILIIHFLFLVCSGCAMLTAMLGTGPIATIAALVSANTLVYAVYFKLIVDTAGNAPVQSETSLRGARDRLP
jgi:O-antigen/teichoic acid export membrane protein